MVADNVMYNVVSYLMRLGGKVKVTEEVVTESSSKLREQERSDGTFSSAAKKQNVDF